ncbi:hypothetical protein EV194_109114 [Natronoflexus pectinivorans]|uniref:Uncharacterized protein n=1 Tax=Natronoflexus pectinivorans TaxID=682526 RepID=A0A4R2GGA0_9BACT|nr:hypothetical protein EV194_109114 [Natronoflexus pectinivorans]
MVMKRAMIKPSHAGESKIGVTNDYDGEFHPEYSEVTKKKL